MTIIRHPTNSAIFVGTPEEFDLAVEGEFSAAGHWIVSVNDVEQDLMCLEPEQAMREGERVFELNAQRFQEDMIRCRGIEFAHLGMMVEVNGEMGTIQGMNASANLDVLFTNQLKHGKHTHNCHPSWNVKYFDGNGTLIAHFAENECVLRPERPAA